MTDVVLTRDSVVQFLNRFEETAEKENFDLIQDMIHDNAFIRFNDGDFVGKQAVRGARSRKPGKAAPTSGRSASTSPTFKCYLSTQEAPLPRIPTTGKEQWMGGPSGFKVEEHGFSWSRTGSCRSSMNTLAATPSSEAGRPSAAGDR